MPDLSAWRGDCLSRASSGQDWLMDVRLSEVSVLSFGSKGRASSLDTARTFAGGEPYATPSFAPPTLDELLRSFSHRKRETRIAQTQATTRLLPILRVDGRVLPWVTGSRKRQRRRSPPTEAAPEKLVLDLPEGAVRVDVNYVQFVEASVENYMSSPTGAARGPPKGRGPQPGKGKGKGRT